MLAGSRGLVGAKLQRDDGVASAGSLIDGFGQRIL